MKPSVFVEVTLPSKLDFVPCIGVLTARECGKYCFWSCSNSWLSNNSSWVISIKVSTGRFVFYWQMRLKFFLLLPRASNCFINIDSFPVSNTFFSRFECLISSSKIFVKSYQIVTKYSNKNYLSCSWDWNSISPKFPGRSSIIDLTRLSNSDFSPFLRLMSSIEIPIEFFSVVQTYASGTSLMLFSSSEPWNNGNAKECRKFWKFWMLKPLCRRNFWFDCSHRFVRDQFPVVEKLWNE